MTDELSQEISIALCSEIERLLDVPVLDVQPDLSLGELGLDSLGFVELSQFIKKRFKISLPPDELYEHPSIGFTAQWLASETAGSVTVNSPKAIESHVKPGRQDHLDIGIVGVSFRLPGANCWQELTPLLATSSAFSPIPVSRWPKQASKFNQNNLRAGILDNVSRFDASFFRISPREAIAMDPQQRLLMESAWHALEDAGLTAEQWQGTKTSVFVGASSFDYAELLRETSTGRASHIGTGLSHAILANRLSQFFNFRGSSETLDTACSSSLVALWRAVRELRSGDADMALVAGVNVFASETPFKAFAEAGMLSPNGLSLPFDANAAGYVRGEGVVALLLKPMHVVREQGGTVLGIIKGGAVRHSGRTQSLTAPNPEAQAEVVRAAIDDARITANAISYIEAHGTGTSLGDPIEIRGLKKVFGENSINGSASSGCRLGSFKSQIGHLEAAAGLAAVVKVLHCFRQRLLPGNPQISTLNPLIDLQNSQLCIDQESSAWKLSTNDQEEPRIAGVSSFGFGGTNAHVILEEPTTETARSEWEQSRYEFQGVNYWPVVEKTSGETIDQTTAIGLIESANDASAKNASDISDEVGDDINSVSTNDVICERIRWVAEPLQLTPTELIKQDEIAWVIVDGPRGKAVVDALITQNATRNWIIVSWTELTAAARYERDKPALWLDLSSLDNDSDLCSSTAVERLNRMAVCLGSALKRGESIQLVQVTSQLQDLNEWGYPCLSLAGAAINGWYNAVASEYRHAESKSIDFADPHYAAGAMASVLLQEVQSSFTHRAVVYAGSRRMVPEWATINLKQSALSSLHNAVVLVTGGLGDIGRQLITDLTTRKVKAILLTGRGPVTEAIEQQLMHWRNNLSCVEYAQCQLTDSHMLSAVLDEFSVRKGKFSHVFHCAGFVDDNHLAFYNKNKAGMAKVFEPKVDALNSLHRYFETRHLKQFVLFSSISAAKPDKAVGLLDYAAANRYMDFYAAFRNKSGAAVYKSIQWEAWATTRMGSKTRKGNDQAIKALTSEAALSTLYQVMDLPQDYASIKVESGVVAKLVSSPVSATVPQAQFTLEHAVTPIAVDPSVVDALKPELRRLVATELETEVQNLDDHIGFDELGIDSIVLMDLINAIERWTSHTISPTELIRCNSIAATAEYLVQIGFIGNPSKIQAELQHNPKSESDAEVESQFDNADGQAKTPAVNAFTDSKNGVSAPFKVAVIGMACQMPGAPDVQRFWNNLKAGVDSVVKVPESDRRDSPLGAHPMPRWAGLIDGFDTLYPQLYNFTEEDAADVDPLVRLFTECALSAVHNSPIGLKGIADNRVGVFAGARTGRYGERIDQPSARSITGIGQNFIAAYLSHILNLHGPNMVIDTACSSSLTAIHLACNSMRSGDCDMAIAGGVDLILDQKTHAYLQSARALSPDGRCRPFSANANGFVPGEGVGTVLLKPLSKAMQDGDAIYAVIDGSAINNDGKTLGITTPGSEGQTDVIKLALRNSQVDSRDISYVEAHGTGTMIGDPIELQSLSKAYQQAAPDKCGVGSVKSNIGHLLSAAGVASFIKVVLSLHHRTLPPTLHCEDINPRIGFDQLPFYPVLETQPWPEVPAGCKAGVSAFGFGKTNVHMILSERPKQAAKPQLRVDTLPKSFTGERIRAWHDVTPVKKVATVKKRGLLTVTNVVVEEYE